MFYPGESIYFNIFANNRALFLQQEKAVTLKINPVPITRTDAKPETTAGGLYLVDLPSFTPVLATNPHKHLYPASTTKVITALVAYDVFKPDDVITVKRVIEEGQVMGLVKGEHITVENLLYGMLVYSGNDAAYAFADAYGYDTFIELMNKKAKKMGMKDTHFRNPAGFDDPQQYSTAYDLALASRELLKNKLLKKIVSTKEIIISDEDFKIFHKLTNVNKLLGEIQGIGGLKTGYTEIAGENLISFYKKGTHEFIIVILNSLDRFSDTKNVVKWIDENVSYITVKDLQ
jgi:D-alanyl-D-alanine carboxypeptidase (penicillin-binding protein 5/6)